MGSVVLLAAHAEDGARKGPNFHSRRLKVAIHKNSRLKRIGRCKQIEKFLVLGLSIDDMAERLGVNERTVRRDMEWRYDQFTAHGQHEVAVARTALMAEVGRTYAEAIRECEQAKLNGEPTYPYINSRIRALALMAKLTGAEMPAKLIVQGQIGVTHQVDPPSRW
jgi:DNA-binding CsgD family transcriptional regulator